MVIAGRAFYSVKQTFVDRIHFLGRFQREKISLFRKEA